MAKGVTVLGILTTFLAKCAIDEVRAWLPWCARRFFDLSVRLLPLSEKERYSEEWRSHIESFPGSSLASAHFIWAALEIRFLVTMNATHERWTRFRAHAVLFGLVVYCWLGVRLPRVFGAEKPVSLGSAAQNSNLLLGVLLIAIAFVLCKQQSEALPPSSGSPA